jgi:hypothetical protein
MAIFFAGCATSWPEGPARRHARTDIDLHNNTPEQIDEVEVYFGDYRPIGGLFAPGGIKTHMYFGSPITPTAIVRWKDARNAQKEQNVNLVGIYEPKVDGKLEFMIGPTNVTATFTRINPR